MIEIFFSTMNEITGKTNSVINLAIGWVIIKIRHTAGDETIEGGGIRLTIKTEMSMSIQKNIDIVLNKGNKVNRE